MNHTHTHTNTHTHTHTHLNQHWETQGGNRKIPQLNMYPGNKVWFLEDKEKIQFILVYFKKYSCVSLFLAVKLLQVN